MCPVDDSTDCNLLLRVWRLLLVSVQAGGFRTFGVWSPCCILMGTRVCLVALEFCLSYPGKGQVVGVKRWGLLST